MSKFAIPETRYNLEGKKLRSITRKYGNFKFGNIYDVHSHFKNLKGQPTNYQIYDDDGDAFSISVGDIGKMFEIVEEE